MGKVINFPLINDYTLDWRYQNYYDEQDDEQENIDYCVYENYYSNAADYEQQYNNRNFLQKLLVKLINRLCLYI
jgi:hypothetical protein